MKPETRIKKLCDKAGFDVVFRPNGHWQIKGPLLVNYYPNARTAYIAGTTEKLKNVTIDRAVELASECPDLYKKDKRKGNTRLLRERMFKKQKRCHWCGEPMNLVSPPTNPLDATIEHIVPLSKGGLDNSNNRTLAHKKCNQARGNEMTELTA